MHSPRYCKFELHSCYNCLTMNYFLSNLFRDWKVYALVGLAVVAGLNIMDILTTMFGLKVFNLWVVKITIGAAFVSGIVYGFLQYRHEKKNRQLESMLPAFIAERKACFEKKVAKDPQFQTFCHECRHYDNGPRRCLLRLHGRKIRIKLQQESMFSYCLYWNLDDHPVLALTERVEEMKGEQKIEG
jgi:hypothetical protein